MRASLWFLLALAGCAPAIEPLDTTEGGRGGGKADTADPPADLGTEGYVLRGSLDWDETGVASIERETFDHRGGSSSVFPFTAYPDSTLDLTLTLDDMQMRDRARAWLVGPLDGDGGFETAQAFTHDGARAMLHTAIAEYGSYAVVVAPGDTLPRYPAPRARFRASSGEDVVMQLASSLDGRTRLLPDVVAPSFESASPRAAFAAPMATGLEIVDPPPEAFDAPSVGLESATPRAAFAAPMGRPMFRARNASGEIVGFELVEWLRDVELVPEREGASLRGTMGSDGTIEARDGTGEVRTLLVVEAIGADGTLGATEPAMLVTVPSAIDGRSVAIIEVPGCADAQCPHAAVYVREDGAYAPEDQVADSQLVTFRVTPSREGEPSTFGLSLECAGACGLRSAAAPLQGRFVPRPRHPVYFAHGFNATHSTWDEVRRVLDQGNPQWVGFHDAADVPKHADVSVRARALARNLAAFVARLTPLEGEPYVRINVVAHSMGGLDTRYLMGHPDFNERCLETGTCVADGAGQPIFWRQRIVSVTTLSTPHCGSRNSSWGRERLQGGAADWTFRRIAGNFMGMGDAEQSAFRSALNALSLEYHGLVDACRDRALPLNSIPADPSMPNFGAPVWGRQYPWSCAVAGTCPVAEGHGPRDVDGAMLLPPPVDDATVFSWGSVTCVTGACGDVVSPTLALPYGIERELGPNDGVVATSSARFGIYMGARPGDHLTWTAGEHSTNTWAAWYYGIRKAPIASFYAEWFGLLGRSGY